MNFLLLILDIVQDSTISGTTTSESDSTSWIIIFATIFILVGFYFLKRSKSSFPKSLPLLKQINRKKVDGTLVFEDIVGWFKSIDNIDKETDTPFIADANKFKDMLGPSSSKKSILIGVYNKKNDVITHHLLLEADDIDKKTREILGGESLVVLN